MKYEEKYQELVELSHSDGNQEYIEPRSGLDGGYEILPPDSPRIKEIEEYSRKLRPALYAELDMNKDSKNLNS